MLKRWSLAGIVLPLCLSLAVNASAQSDAGIPRVKGDTVTTKTGLKCIDAKAGTGAKAKVGDNVSVHYTGWLSNGTKFDSSKDRGQPFMLPLGKGWVIKGWDEGLQGMAVGGRRILIIPPELGYGAQDNGVIPPNSTLVFEVEMLGITQPPQMPAFNKAGLQKTGSGLMYTVLKPGTGAMPQAGQTVRVHYSGWLENGKLFDSSVGRGTPFEFPLGAGRVIKGWDEGVAMMQVGEKRLLVIPPQLGYGEKDIGNGLIPPNSTLVFEVELLEIMH